MLTSCTSTVGGCFSILCNRKPSENGASPCPLLFPFALPSPGTGSALGSPAGGDYFFNESKNIPSKELCCAVSTLFAEGVAQDCWLCICKLILELEQLFFPSVSHFLLYPSGKRGSLCAWIHAGSAVAICRVG